jgi:hypothetical protein
MFTGGGNMDKGWEVEWCTHIPVLPCGDSDIDNATLKHKDFATEAEAFEFARKVFPQDKFGCVRVTEFWSEFYEQGRPGKYREYGREEFVDEPA